MSQTTAPPALPPPSSLLMPGTSPSQLLPTSVPALPFTASANYLQPPMFLSPPSNNGAPSTQPMLTAELLGGGGGLAAPGIPSGMFLTPNNATAVGQHHLGGAMQPPMYAPMAEAGPPAQAPMLGLAPSVGGMNPMNLLAFLQQQQQPIPNSELLESSMNPTASTTPKPSVEDFVPVVPQNLLSFVRSHETSGPPGTGAGGAGPTVTVGVPAHARRGADARDAGAVIHLEAPKIAPEVERRAREARRAHISGFPRGTSAEELMEFFQLVIPDVRRVKTQREVRALALAAGDAESEIRDIPASALTDLDTIIGLTVNMAKSKPFAFIEVSYADMISELVEESSLPDVDRFMFTAMDGRQYALTIRRPRDYEPLDGVDETQVVMVGFPPSLGEEKLRPAFEQFGELEAFGVQDGMAYARFADTRDAQECRTDLHGTVLGSRMVAVLPLYDWLKCICVDKFPIIIEDDDPISGTAALQGITRGNDAVGGGPCWANSTALSIVKQVEKVDHMKELLMMATPLPDMIARLSLTFPHLRSLYGNGSVPIYPTRILVLLNMFDEEELTLDDTYQQLLTDIELEVEQYGCVEQLIVPRREARPRAPPIPAKGIYETPEEESAAFADYELAKMAFTQALDTFMERQIHPIHGGIGRVFVLYSTVEEAAYAQQQIAGKLYGNRTVVTSFMFEDVLLNASDARDDEDGDADNAGAAADGETAEGAVVTAATTGEADH